MVTSVEMVATARFTRQDVEFSSGGVTCRAWLFSPSSVHTGKSPCIVMAHGFGATREASLAQYAERFAEDGYFALVFDYRHFGASDGLPRQLLSIHSQLEDYQAAIDFARTLPAVDPERIALWGSSFSGGHVIAAAVNDGRVAAVSSQCPMMDDPTARFARDPPRNVRASRPPDSLQLAMNRERLTRQTVLALLIVRLQCQKMRLQRIVPHTASVAITGKSRPVRHCARSSSIAPSSESHARHVTPPRADSTSCCAWMP